MHFFVLSENVHDCDQWVTAYRGLTNDDEARCDTRIAVHDKAPKGEIVHLHWCFGLPPYSPAP